jgi:16S rRNA (cytidine1402-2'-O)-methyltransferase
MRSHHKFNEHVTAAKIATEVLDGQTIALISDAGTPGISDPGFLLVRTCIEMGARVESLPGATAFVPALIQSGFPSDRFCFEGFLPQKKGRQSRLNALADEQRTMIFYESPFRILKTMEQFGAVFGLERAASVSRELTKKFEQTVRGTLAEVIEHFSEHPPKGEFVIVIKGKNE